MIMIYAHEWVSIQSNLIIRQTLGLSEIGRLASVYHAWCMNLFSWSQSNWRYGIKFNQIGNN